MMDQPAPSLKTGSEGPGPGGLAAAPGIPVGRRRLRSLIGLLPILAAMNVVIGAQEILRGHVAQDYRYSFVAGRIGLASGWARIYSFSLQQQEWGHFWSDRFKPFINPPPVAWIGAPLALLPWPAARVLGTIGAGLLALLTVLLAAPRDWRLRLAYGVLAVAFSPLLGAVRDGQTVLLVAVGIVLGVRLIESGRVALAGIAFSLIGVKPHLALMVPIALAVTGHWRTIVAFLGASALWIAASLISVGMTGVHDYLSLLQWAASFETQRQRSPMWLGGSGAAIAGVEATAVVGVVAAMVWLRRNRLRVALAVAVIGSLVVSPYTNGGDLILLLLPLWLAFEGRWSAFVWIGAGLLGAVEVLELFPPAVPVAEVVALGAFAIAGRRSTGGLGGRENRGAGRDWVQPRGRPPATGP
jgi:hypothetical protein